MIFCGIVILIVVLYVGLLVYEIRNAHEVDSKEPFLYGDYDPANDPTLKNNVDKEEK